MDKSKFLVFIVLIVAGCSGDKEQREVLYYSDSTVMYEGKFINGKREGTGISYFENGKIRAKAFWRNGKRDGEEIIYYEDGSKEQENLYQAGLLVRSKDYSKDGFLEKLREYDSLGRLFDTYNYKKDGTRDFSRETKDPIFIPEIDTVVVGEYLIKEIRLGNRQYSHVDVIIGDVEDEDIIQKNKPLPKKDSLTSILKIKADSVGMREISGVVFERNQTWDSMDVIPFTHRYYVKEK